MAVALLLAYVADLLLGDPVWMPHPVVGFGKAISFFEKRWNSGCARIAKGLAMTLLLVAGTWGLFYVVMKGIALLGNVADILFTALFLFMALANRTLVREGRMVFRRLKDEGVDAGRQQLSRIVGRDTSNLSPQQIRTAVLETMAENLSDGVVAPLFWFAVGGVPAALAYKMVNTLDSMVGYKNERFLLFGRAAARLDDVANFVPARLTALLMAMVTLSPRALVFVFRYGHKHSSPNSGYPEAALAGFLNVRFGGPNIYHGKLVEKPFIGSNDRTIGHRDFSRAAYVNHAVCLLTVVLLALAMVY